MPVRDAGTTSTARLITCGSMRPVPAPITTSIGSSVCQPEDASSRSPSISPAATTTMPTACTHPTGIHVTARIPTAEKMIIGTARPLAT